MAWFQAGEVEPTVNNYRILGLVEGTEYFFRVVAVNEEGLSPPLETTDATVPSKEICK